MQIDKQIQAGNDKLLLVFAGWSASPATFQHLQVERDTDCWICYDYRDISFQKEALSAYKEIRVIAWSLGVWVASVLLPTLSVHCQEAIAINGTQIPIHDEWGIPTAIFKGTLDHITEEGVMRFNKRMCGTREQFNRYCQLPARPLDEIREELQALYTAIEEKAATTPLFTGWTKAVISSEDRIFPSANLLAFWQTRCPIQEIKAPHYPFFQWRAWKELWS